MTELSFQRSTMSWSLLGDQKVPAIKFLPQNSSGTNSSSEPTSDLSKFSWEGSLKRYEEAGVGKNASVKLNGIILLISKIHDLWWQYSKAVINGRRFPNEREAVCRFKSRLVFSWILSNQEASAEVDEAADLPFNLKVCKICVSIEVEVLFPWKEQKAETIPSNKTLVPLDLVVDLYLLISLGVSLLQLSSPSLSNSKSLSRFFLPGVVQMSIATSSTSK